MKETNFNRSARVVFSAGFLFLGCNLSLAADPQADEPRADNPRAEEAERVAEGTTDGIDTISVTASRIERATKEVANSIAVVDEDRIEASNMLNVKEAIQGTPGVLIDTKNGGYSTRLIIRGSGLKARYGVREVQVLRDGVPMTDPDSFSRFDFIDTQDIERIEILKGPGSLYGAGSAGGTVQIISKSVFDTEGDRIKIGLGEQGAENFNLRYAEDINDANAFRITASYRALDNDWRHWNEFDTQQISLKHGLMFDDGATLETELSYSEADLQLPGSMDEDQFREYLRSGEQDDNKDPWKHSGRYSTIWFFNSRYEKEWGDFTFKPRFYFNTWDHYHPVTGAINDNPGTDVMGIDLEFDYAHQLLGSSTLVAGVTARRDDTDESGKYKYADLVYNRFSGRADYTESDRKGDLMEEEAATNTLYGIYMQETLRPTNRLTADIGFRYDRVNFDIDTLTYWEYSYRSADYSRPDGWSGTPIASNVDKTYDLLSPRVGLTYALNDRLNAYVTVAQSDQVPSESEIQSNNSLDASTARNFEVGLKQRAQNWTLDLSLYKTDVTDDIVSTYDAFGDTIYSNAGDTDKQGLELSSRFEVAKGLSLGANYSYTDYTFDKFMEPVGRGRMEDRSGNQLPFIPRHQYSLSADYNHPSGFKARVQADTWGEYYMDNENTEKYGGYEFVTSLMLGYEKGSHSLTLNVDNLFDDYYAVEAKKDISGSNSYAAASPRLTLLTYIYNF